MAGADEHPRGIESLTVYHDYSQTMRLLRASFNRVFNTLDTSIMKDADRAEAQRLCEATYARCTELGPRLLRAIHDAIKAGSKEEGVKQCKELQAHNRRLARLNKVFESDVSDTHPNPDDFYVKKDDGDEEMITPPTIDTSVPVKATKFLAKLKEIDDEIDRKVKRRASTK